LAFWAIVPLTLIYCILVWRHILRAKSGDKSKKFPVTRLILFASGIMSIGLTSQTENNLLRVGLIALAITMVWYAMKRDKNSANRMFPVNTLVPNSAIGSSYWYNLFFTCTFIFALLYSTLYLQILHKQTPIFAAYISATLSFCWTIGALACASWKGPKVKFSIVGGGFLIFFGAIGLVLFAVKGPLILIMLSLGLIGFGIGSSNIHVMSLTIDCAADGDRTLVASSIQTMRNMGLAFGSALAGLLANIAGLTEGADVDIISRAVDLIHFAAIILAILTVLSLIIFIVYCEKERQNY
jgi:MFS family permease